ncbi:MAG: helix-turn-helix transcriptional regulator [Ilumatobacteraceae bacterium]
MTLVAEIRARAGLTQAELAARAGTSRTRVSAYENAHTAPELDTLTRLATVARAELVLAPWGTRRVKAQIDDIGASVADGRTSDAVRLVAELVAWVRDGVVELDALAQEPASVGDRRWDALLAGVAEMLFSEARRAVPGWASSPARILDQPWFVSRLRSLWPEILVTTPAALAARGVHISARSLESV